MDAQAEAILLVEDDPNDAELTMRALKKANVANRIVHVKNGADALEVLFAADAAASRSAVLPPEIAVVVLDLKLPKVSGLEVLKRIRAGERTRTLPVVILTSSDEQRDLVDSYQLGANSYVRKPVDFAQFVEAVTQVGLYWCLINRLPGRG